MLAAQRSSINWENESMGYAIEETDIPSGVNEKIQQFFLRKDLLNKSIMIYSAGLLTRRILDKKIIWQF
jgi:hypothetical protein